MYKKLEWYNSENIFTILSGGGGGATPKFKVNLFFFLKFFLL